VKRELLVLQGLVQGVFFRQTVLEIAARYAVAGSVRNLRDGTLELDVEGEPEVLATFVADVLENPPPLARVAGVRREARTPRGMRGFVVKGSG